MRPLVLSRSPVVRSCHPFFLRPHHLSERGRVPRANDCSQHRPAGRPAGARRRGQRARVCRRHRVPREVPAAPPLPRGPRGPRRAPRAPRPPPLRPPPLPDHLPQPPAAPHSRPCLPPSQPGAHMVAHFLLWGAAHPVAAGVQQARLGLHRDLPCDAPFPFLDVVLDELDRLWGAVAASALVATPAAKYAFLATMLQGRLNCSVCRASPSPPLPRPHPSLPCGNPGPRGRHAAVVPGRGAERPALRHGAAARGVRRDARARQRAGAGARAHAGRRARRARRRARAPRPRCRARRDGRGRVRARGRRGTAPARRRGRVGARVRAAVAPAAPARRGRDAVRLRHRGARVQLGRVVLRARGCAGARGVWRARRRSGRRVCGWPRPDVAPTALWRHSARRPLPPPTARFAAPSPFSLSFSPLCAHLLWTNGCSCCRRQCRQCRSARQSSRSPSR